MLAHLCVIGDSIMKRVLRFLCLFMVVILLSACAPPESSPLPDDPPDAIGTLPLEILQYDLATTISSNESAACYMRDIPESFYPEGYDYFTSRIVYLMAYKTDFATATTRPLCSYVGCSHDSPYCMAWIRAVNPFITIFAAGDRLFWVSQAASKQPIPGRSEEDEGYYSYIYMSDSEGQGRRCLYTSAKYVDIDRQYLVYDGVHLIFMETDPVQGEQLITISVDTGQIMSRYPIPYLPSTYFFQAVGLRENKLILMKSSGNSVEPLPDENPVPELDIQLYTVDLQTGSFAELRSFHVASIVFTWTQTMFIYVNYRAREIVQLDIATGAEKVVGELPKGIDNFRCFSLYEGHLLLICGQSGSPYCLDIDTGEITDFTLFYQDFWGQWQPVDILADAGAEYLVIMGARHSLLDSPLRDYDVLDNSLTHLRSALIPKDDYWNGIANYREVELEQ